MSKDILTLEQRVYYECVDMADYAYSAGLQVPGKILEALNELAKYFENFPETVGAGYKVTPAERDIKKTNLPQIDAGQAKKMSNIHNMLSEIVAPARPGTLFLFAQERRRFRFWYILGPVPLIRYMAFLAIFSLIAFICLSLSPYINVELINKSMFELAGWEVILNLTFLLTASSLGALFAAMYQANKYVSNNTFDTIYENSYWIRYILGLMAGLIISQLVPLNFAPAGAGADGSPDQMVSALQAIAKPTLALLAGFSADLVYRILSRLVEAVSYFIKGNLKAEKEKILLLENEYRMKSAAKNIENQMHLASKLTELNQQIDSTQKPEEIREQINKILKTLLPDEDE